MPKNMDETEYRRRVEEERAKMAAGSEKKKKEPASGDNKVNKIAPRAVPRGEDEEDQEAAELEKIEPEVVAEKETDTGEIAGSEEIEVAEVMETEEPETTIEQVDEPEEITVAEVAEPKEVEAKTVDDKATQKLLKKEASDARKTEAKLRKELISTYDKRVANYLKTRASRDAYWLDKDWYRREFLDHKSIEKRQRKLYKKQIQYMWKNSAYMRVRMEGQGILKSGHVKNIADINKLPFVTDVDLAKSQREAPPCGYIYSAKPEEMVDIGVTGDMSEVPRYFFMSKKDLANAYRLIRPIMAAGITSSDIAVVLSREDFWGLPLICDMLKQDIGCIVICVAALDAKRKMQVITDLKATVLVGTPSQVQTLADAGTMMGMEVAQRDVRIILTAGEIGIGSSVEIGRAMEQAWNAKAYEFYGCQDVGALAWSCDAGEGLHLMEDDYVFEIIDPDTNEPVPDGGEGELVVTPLLNYTVPVTRYRTRDIVSKIAEACPCHRTMTRIVIKRKLASEPVLPDHDLPEDEVIEPEPVGVGAGISEIEAEAAAEDIGGELVGDYKEMKPPAESEDPDMGK